MLNRSSPATPVPGGLRWLTFVYALLIVYGSLFPFSGWHLPENWYNPLLMPWPRYDSSADVFINVLAYVPLGLLLGLSLRNRGRFLAPLLAVGAGFALSFCMELAQETLPARVSSVQDIANDTLGAAIGAAAAFILSADSFAGIWMRRWRAGRFTAGVLSTLALLALLVWAAMELLPFLPVFRLRALRAGLRPLLQTLHDPARFYGYRALADMCMMTGVGLLVRIVAHRPVTALLAALFTLVAVLKVAIVDQALSLEFATAAVVATAVIGALSARDARSLAWIALGTIVLSEVITELLPGAGGHRHTFNWIPFAVQLGSLAGIHNLLHTLWVALGLAVLARMLTPADRHRAVFAVGGALLFVAWFALEWHQQALPGRIPNITDSLVALSVWYGVWALPLSATGPVASRSRLRRG